MKKRRWIYRRKDSPYWWYTFKITGKPRVSGCTEERDEKAAQLIADYKRSDYIAGKIEKRPAAVTLDTFLRQWLKTYSRKPSFVTKQGHVNGILDFFNKKKPLAALTTADVLKLRTHLDGLMKSPTVNQYIGSLRRAFNWEIKLNKEFGITQNPCDGISKYSEKPSERIRYLKADEKIRLYNALPTYLLKMVIFSTKTAVRQGDLRNLRWSMVDLDTAFLRLAVTKEGKPRNVPLHPDAVAILAGLPRRGEYVFCNEDGAQLSRHGFMRSQFLKALDEAGIVDFRWHDLRHTFATWTINAGGDLKPMGLVMGHSTVKMTERYSHLDDEVLRSQVNLQGSDLKYLAGKGEPMVTTNALVIPTLVKFSTN